jgi:hypothetical protein
MLFKYRKYTERIDNEKGIALVSALILAAVGMLMTASLLVMVGTGTWFSGSKNRYQKALSAAHGSMNFFAREVVQQGLRGNGVNTLGNYGGLLTPAITDARFATKLTTSGNITDAVYPNDPIDATTTFTFPDAPNMAVNSVILSASRGNSSMSANRLGGGGVVFNQSGTVTPQHIPYIYQTDSQTQDPVFTIESARLSSIYAY